MRRLFICAIACLAVACTPLASVEPPGAAPPSTVQVAEKVAVAAADVADALQVAPPSAITGRVTIDDKAVRIAFLSLEGAATAVELAFDFGLFERNSPTAKRLSSGMLSALRWLKVASSAQRAGQATSYREALANAQAALAGVQSAIGK